MTGDRTEHDRARSPDAGFVAHLVEPLEVDRLVTILAGLVAARAAGERRVTRTGAA